MKRIILAAALCCLCLGAYAQTATTTAIHPTSGRRSNPERTSPSTPKEPERPIRPVPAPTPVPPPPVRPAPKFHPEYNGVIYTFYDINAPVGYGLTTDEDWCRETNETMLDTGYSPRLPELPVEFLPPAPTKEHPADPFADNTKSIFTSHSRTVGSDGGVDNASWQKEVVAIELFGHGRTVPVDIVDAARYYVAKGIERRGRHYVLDAQCELGTYYNGEPVYYGGRSGYFHFTPRMEKLYCKGVRYVVSGVVTNYFTHSYYASETAKNPTFEVLMTVYLTAYDLDTHTIMQTRILNLRGHGSKPGLADENAVSDLDSQAFLLSNDCFKILSSIVGLGEPDKKGKIKTCAIDCGVEAGVQKTDIFWVYTPGNLSKKLGKVKVTAPGEGYSECNITGGAEDVARAVIEGREPILLSEGQALF